jgi:hypothetical protein
VPWPGDAGPEPDAPPSHTTAAPLAASAPAADESGRSPPLKRVGAVTDRDTSTCPEPLNAVMVATLTGETADDEEEVVGPASATHPLTGAMLSVPPPAKPVTLTCATPLPALALTTRVGSPSATPTMLALTSLRAWAGSGVAYPATVVPTIFVVDTSAWKRGPVTAHEGMAYPWGNLIVELTRKPRTSTDPAVRVNRGCRRSGNRAAEDAAPVDDDEPGRPEAASGPDCSDGELDPAFEPDSAEVATD